MKKLFMSLAVLACAALTVACSGNGKITEGNKGELDSLSYCIGADIGRNLHQQFGPYNINAEELKAGLKGGLLEKSDITSDEAIDKLDAFFGQTVAERQAEFQKTQEQDTTAVFNLFINEEENKEVAYALGVAMGSNVLRADFPIQYYWLLKAIDDAFAESFQLTEDEMRGFMMHYYTVVIPAEAKQRSEEWLAKKEKESGVQKTESGLLYKVVEAGDMEKAAKNDGDTVKVHYVGKLNSGKVFDSSRFENRPEDQKKMMRKHYPSMFDENGNPVKADEPIEFPLNGVIKGWTEGMKLVGPGGKIVLYIPSDMAYGPQGAPRGGIGPNEALEFEVELIEVKPATVEETPAVEAEPAK
jgi:FKBP-type peptidyl-prolyl cis-trans isomerase FkpA